MNIVHVVESLDVGGLERVVLSLAAWQRSRGDRSDIVCLYHEGALAAQSRAAGIPASSINKKPGLDLGAIWSLRRHLVERRPDVVHTHNAAAHYYAAAAVTGGLGPRRLINTRHGMGASRGARRQMLLYRAALNGTQHVVTVCAAARDQFVATRQIPASKASVIPNGTAVAQMEPRSTLAKHRLLATLGRPLETVLVGVVGRLSAVKNHELLFEVMRRLRAIDRGVDLVVIGDGERRPQLEARVQELALASCVHFLGMRNDVNQLLSALDVFALPSTSEGYSLALVEAAAAALPIVATDVGGNREIVEHDRSGLLVASQDASAMTASLVRLVDDPALRERMGAHARQWALQNGSIDAMGAAYRALYERSTRSCASSGGPDSFGSARG